MNDNSSQTTKDWLVWATQQLSAENIATSQLDALVLLEDCLQIPRANILAHPETQLSRDKIEKLGPQIARRKTHEPLAYIRGKTEFYGREFIVNHYTLEPRPETEAMIELLKKYCPDSATIADIGTGSGAIAITAALEIPRAVVVATDVSSKCLAVTKKNIQKFSLAIQCFEGDLLDPLKEQKLDVLLCNLPYVPDDFDVNEAARHEPKLALFGGKDGLDLYRKLFAQINERAQKPKLILTESLPNQHKELEQIAQKSGYKLQETNDFIQVFVI